MARRLLGSLDIYGGAEREPEKSVNFVTRHNSFTFGDLVSYNGKENEAAKTMRRTDRASGTGASST